MKSTKKLVISALFTALCCIGTMIHVPTGITSGYVHLGDAMVLFSGIILGPVYGGLAAGLGSALADLINGYAIFVPGTFIIKGLCAIVCGYIFHSKTKKDVQKKYIYIFLVISGVVGEALMVLGYLIYETILFFITEGAKASFAPAVASAALGIPFNILQGVMAVILSVLLIPILLKINDLREIILD